MGTSGGNARGFAFGGDAGHNVPMADPIRQNNTSHPVTHNNQALFDTFDIYV